MTFRNKGQLKIDGEIAINGMLVKDPAQLAAISGYVQQGNANLLIFDFVSIVWIHIYLKQKINQMIY